MFEMQMAHGPLHHSIDIIESVEMSSRLLDSSDSTDSTKSSTNLFAEISSSLLLFLLIFGMSGTVNTHDLRRQLQNKYAIGIGIAMQFLIMPFLGYIAVMVLTRHGLSAPMGIMVLMVTTSPGGSYSNWWCSLFNADLALSVAMTALSTVLSMIFLPANLLFYSHLAYGFNNSEQNVLRSVDFPALFISIAIVICGIVLGLYASYKMQSASFQKTANALGSISGLALIAFSAVFSTTSGGEDAKPWQQPWSFYIGVLLPCLGGLLASNILARVARLNKPEVVTLSVECCYQNVGIATSAALGMFDDPKDIAQALAVPLCYGIIEAVILGIYCLVAWKLGWTKAPREEKFCVVLTKTFEIEDINTEGENESMASIEDQDVIESMDMVCSMDRTKTSDSELEEGKGASRDRFESTELTEASTLSDTGDTSRSSSKRSTASTQVMQQGYHASGIPRPSRHISPRQIPYHDMHDDDAFDCASLSPIHSDKEQTERSVCDEADDNNEDLDMSNSINDQPHTSLTPKPLNSRVNHSSSFQSCIEVSLTKSHSSNSQDRRQENKTLNSRSYSNDSDSSSLTKSHSSHSSLTPKSLNSRVNRSSSFESCIEVSLTKSRSSNSQDRCQENNKLSSRSPSNDSDASQLLIAASIVMSEGQALSKSHLSNSQESDKHSVHSNTELKARSPSHVSCPPELLLARKDESEDDIFSHGAHSV